MWRSEETMRWKQFVISKVPFCSFLRNANPDRAPQPTTRVTVDQELLWCVWERPCLFRSKPPAPAPDGGVEVYRKSFPRRKCGEWGWFPPGSGLGPRCFVVSVPPREASRGTGSSCSFHVFPPPRDNEFAYDCSLLSQVLLCLLCLKDVPFPLPVFGR